MKCYVNLKFETIKLGLTSRAFGKVAFTFSTLPLTVLKRCYSKLWEHFINKSFVPFKKIFIVFV